VWAGGREPCEREVGSGLQWYSLINSLPDGFELLLGPEKEVETSAQEKTQ
jgi:hypothetical protein